MSSILVRIHRAFVTRCPFCDKEQEVSEVDVFVLFRRMGICFTRCKRCYQVFNVDEELQKLSKCTVV